jgi:hypothetical protein
VPAVDSSLIFSRPPLVAMMLFQLKGLGLTTGAQICEHSVDTVFVDQTQTGVRDPQANPTVFRLNPKTTVLQVRQEPALGFVVGVGNIVPNHRAFARDFTYACHVDTPILLNGPD